MSGVLPDRVRTVGDERVRKADRRIAAEASEFADLPPEDLDTLAMIVMAKSLRDELKHAAVIAGMRSYVQASASVRLDVSSASAFFADNTTYSGGPIGQGRGSPRGRQGDDRTRTPSRRLAGVHNRRVTMAHYHQGRGAHRADYETQSAFEVVQLFLEAPRLPLRAPFVEAGHIEAAYSVHISHHAFTVALPRVHSGYLYAFERALGNAGIAVT